MIRILVADDHKIVRDGIVSLLEKEDDMDVIASAENGLEAVKMAHQLTPHIIIMDISMPDLNGIEATHQIVSKHPDIKIIALSMHSDKRFVTRMFSAGVSGYLLKDCAFEELARSIRTVMNGQTYLSPGIAGVMVEEALGKSAPISSVNYDLLTSREREVLQSIAEGKSTKQIAGALHVSVKTIETHRQRIMNKLKIFSVAELTKYAVREGLTTLED